MPIDWPRHKAVVFAALFLVLLCLIPPDGVLSGNEENYFQLAAHSVAAMPAAPESAVFDSAHHRFIADHLLGWLIAATGFSGAQVLARLAAALAYALALGALFRRLDLDALDGVLVVIVFALLGQTLFGGEWLFSGAEAKVGAYALAIAALALTLEGSAAGRAGLLFAAATWCHFLVGGFWFVAALALRFISDRRDWRGPARMAAAFAVAVAPLAAWIAWSRLDVAAPPPAPPSADVIYSIIRLPHHTAPFLALGAFRAHWLPGILLGFGMLASCLVLASLPEAARLRRFALWLALLLFYFVLAFAAAAADRDTGVLGKFYVFRPASLVLLLWLALLAAAVKQIGLPRATALRLLALLLVAPAFLLGAGTRLARDLAAQQGRDLAGLEMALAQHALPGGVVLVDPALEFTFLDLERRTGHPALVLWKFVPTTDAEIREWYRRIEFRRAVFADGCAGKSAYRFDFLLAAPQHAAVLATSCGEPVARAERWVLLRHGS